MTGFAFGAELDDVGAAVDGADDAVVAEAAAAVTAACEISTLAAGVGLVAVDDDLAVFGVTGG